MKHILVPIFTLLIGLLDWNAEASAFCGFLRREGRHETIQQGV